MKRLLLLSSALVMLLGGVAFADHPAPTGFVVDAAGVLSDPVHAKIEAELRDYSRRTTNQVALAIVQTLDGEAVEDYARELFNEWGIGTKAKNNGVLLLIALDDRSDRIQVGLGLESVLTDQVAQGVLDDVITPYAAQEDWSSAALAGERAIRVALHDPRAKAPVAPGQDAGTSPFGGGQASQAPQDVPVDAVPDGSAGFPTEAVPGVQVFQDQHRGFPVVLGVLGVGVVGALALAGIARGRRGGGRYGRGLSSTGVAAGTLLYEQQHHQHSSSTDASSTSAFGGASDGGGGGGGSFGGGSSGDGGASGSW